MEKLRPEEREREYNDTINVDRKLHPENHPIDEELLKCDGAWTPTHEEFAHLMNNYDAKMEKDGMFDAYEGKLPLLPEHSLYMKGYNSVK